MRHPRPIHEALVGKARKVVVTAGGAYIAPFAMCAGSRSRSVPQSGMTVGFSSVSTHLPVASV